MKKAIKITFVLVLAVSAVSLPVLYFRVRPSRTKFILVEITPPIETYDKFFNHPEAWAEVFENVSAIPKFWNATVPSELSGKAIPEISAKCGAYIESNNNDYAYCHIGVPEENHQSLNQTLTGLGFDFKEVVFEHLLSMKTF